MILDYTMLAAVLVALLVLAVSMWQRAPFVQEGFFPSQRARGVRILRLHGLALAAVAGIALVLQFGIGQQRLHALAQKEQSLQTYESELLRLRVEREVVRQRTATAQPTAAAPVLIATSAANAAVTPELAQVMVQRAVVRDGPAGRARFTLASGSRVRLSGTPADSSGKLWREARTDDGRSGWIAVEVLGEVKG